jgi:hypothetical protein
VWKILRAALAAVLLTIGLALPAQGRSAALPAALSAAMAQQPPSASIPSPPPDLSTVQPDQRDRVLPAGWRTSTDLAWTTSGDTTGFHLLVAEASTGYTWRTAASLREPGIDSDQWVGNACITGSGKRAVVVYAPRHFTNREHLFGRGAFAAVVDLHSGKVTKLNVTVTLAYYNPGCGAGETAVLTQSGAADVGKTRVHLLDTVRGVITARHELAGQATSAVPLGGRIAAAHGGKLIAIDADGTTHTLATTRGTAFNLHPDAHGGLAYLQLRDDATSTIHHLEANGKVRNLGHGPLDNVALAAGAGGRVFITGAPANVETPPAGMRQLAAPTDADVSTLGQLSVAHARPSAATALAQPREPDLARLVPLEATVLANGERLTFLTRPGDRGTDRSGKGRTPSPVLRTMELESGGRAAIQASPTDPVDSDRTCSVPRNDVWTQIQQPTWRQVEWAADLAVQDALHIQRPPGWKMSGLPAWSPQGMYPPVTLAGANTKRIPATVMLGVLAQESNLWQASWHALEGVPGNPLVGSYYGARDAWTIDWANADCGYGVAQVTDGMRRGDPSRTPTQQRAIAMDYATNIAAGVQILGEKWNQTYNAGIRVNNANPVRPENWFAAVWAYNTGMNPQAITGNTRGCTPGPDCTDAPGNGPGGNWGLGWGNNPANPDYPYNRKPFLNGSNGEGSPNDAAHPGDWPYPEKVMGWAAYPIIKSDFRNPGTFQPGYVQAWWNDNLFRTQAIKPPLSTFCRPGTGEDGNNCSMNSSGQGSCGRSDLHCWWHWPVAPKHNCTSTTTGSEVIICGFDQNRFNPGAAEPPDGTHYPAACSTMGLPAGALIIDDQPDHVPPIRPCTTTTNAGDFSLTFTGNNATGLYPSKKDFHQIGSGLDGHFWFAHSYSQAQDTAHKIGVTGTWTLTSRWWANVWARVLVHIPGHGAHTQQATYVVDTGVDTDPGPESNRYRSRRVNTKSRYTDTNNRGDRWVSLGVFKFTGTPSVSLSNITSDGEGLHDVAFDAVAFQQLPAKPSQFVVHMGDSYASGEGASTNYVTDYYRETDANGTNRDQQNACHRSPHAWIRKADLSDRLGVTIASREDSWDTTLDFHTVACSGAVTRNLLPGDGTKNAFEETADGQFGETSQVDAGYLDENTTLVTLSIGGNDARFGDVMQHCTQGDPAVNCQDTRLDPDTSNLSVAEPELIRTKVKDSISIVLTQIHKKAPNARIVLMGYPRLFHSAACIAGVTEPAVVRVVIWEAEAAWMNQIGDVLNTEMANAVTPHAAYARFADPRNDFALHGVCSPNGEAIHGIVYGQTPGERPVGPAGGPWETWGPSAQSFHPKKLGTDLYATTLRRTLRAMGL